MAIGMPQGYVYPQTPEQIIEAARIHDAYVQLLPPEEQGRAAKAMDQRQDAELTHVQHAMHCFRCDQIQRENESTSQVLAENQELHDLAQILGARARKLERKVRKWKRRAKQAEIRYHSISDGKSS